MSNKDNDKKVEKIIELAREDAKFQKRIRMFDQYKCLEPILDEDTKTISSDLLVQLTNQYDELFIEHSSLLLEKEQLIIENKAIFQELEDGNATIKTLSQYPSMCLELKSKLEEETDFRTLTVGGLEKYANKLGDQIETYKRLVWILMVTLCVFGIGFFVLLIQRL